MGRGDFQPRSYIWSLPLTKGASKLIVNDRLVHEGTLSPGMLRVCHPADKEERLVKIPFKAVVFTLPLSRFEGFFFASQKLPLDPDYSFCF